MNIEQNIDRNNATVVVIYHFLAHYRKAVFSKLLSGLRGSVVFASDLDGRAIDPTIKAWLPEKETNFKHLPVRNIIRNFYWQPTLIWFAIGSGCKCAIMLGDMNNISTWIAAVIFRLRGVRVLFWAHGWINSKESVIKALIRKVFFALPNGLLLYGRRSKRLAVEQGFRSSNIWVVYNSLDYESQREERELITNEARCSIRLQCFGVAEVPVVACISRLTRVRRLDILIESLSILKESGHECALLLIGDGPERERLELQAERLGVRIYCTGAIYDEARIAPLLCSATVTVAPGKVGLTAMHSLAYGVPVITHGDFDNQMPESEAIVAGVTGDFFRLGDVEDLAACLQRWTLAPDVPSETRYKCIQVIERFYNPESQVKIIESAILNSPQVIISSDTITSEEIS